MKDMFERFMSATSKSESFSKLYNDNFDYVYSFIFIRTAYDAHITEEIVQETFAAAWQAQDRFQKRSAYKTWLCGIARNKLYEHYRRYASNERNQILDIDDIHELPSDFELESIVLGNETRTLVTQTLKQINPIYRYSLIMKYIDGYSVREIAQHLGRTPKAIDGVLQKAKISFAKAYIRIEKGGDSHE